MLVLTVESKQTYQQLTSIVACLMWSSNAEVPPPIIATTLLPTALVIPPL